MGQQTSTVTKASDFDPTQARLTGADGGTPIDTEIIYGQTDHGTDFKVWGDTAANYMLWDESVDSLLLIGTAAKFRLGTFSSSTVGSGVALSASNTAAFRAYGDDGGAAISSGVLARVGEFRHLLTYTAGNREQEAAGIVGKLVSVAGTNRHNMCGVMGSYEAKTSLTVGGQISSTDPWIQAGVIGRVGMSSGTLTVDQYGVLAGLAAMSNVNTATTATYTGRFTGLYVGRWASADEFEYAIYAEDVLHGIYMTADSGTISGEEHGWELDYTGTLSSGDGMVGLDIAVTTAGTSGAWVSGIYAKVTQGATKNVTGYISAAEFEVTNAADNVSDWFVLVLNASNSGAVQGSHSSYIALRDYGSLDIQSLLWVSTDHSIGTKSDTALMTTFADGAHISHAIRIIAGGTPYWILCSSVAPSAT